MKILDCTLRDGGYYTKWDFDGNLVEDYFKSLNNLPIDYVEIGYRSIPQKEYLGEFFYCPDYVLEYAKSLSNKKIAIMLNEKDTRISDVGRLLRTGVGKVDLIRLAVDPQNILRSVELASAIRDLGFEIGFNVMYMSKWMSQSEFLDNLKAVNGVVDFFYMVDSFGGVYPEDVKSICKMVKDKIDVPLGFHGHNNMELALINSLTAVENGVEMLDVTIAGMGRGAGNLKTELLLTALNAKGFVNFDFNYLGKIVDDFSRLQENYRWGTNLPYMVSGANSLPQKDVMEWVGKRFYSFNSIIRALSNQFKGLKDNIILEVFKPITCSKKAIIVGGGLNGTRHSKALTTYLNKSGEDVIIHVSSKNVKAFETIKNTQYHCLLGNEGYRLESTFKNINCENRIAILPPFPRMMGTYIPSFFTNSAFQLAAIDFTDNRESVTAVAIQTAIILGVEEILFVGYDGYDDSVSLNEIELFNENESIFKHLKASKINFYSLTPTRYKELPVRSIYALL